MFTCGVGNSQRLVQGVFTPGLAFLVVLSSFAGHQEGFPVPQKSLEPIQFRLAQAPHVRQDEFLPTEALPMARRNNLKLEVRLQEQIHHSAKRLDELRGKVIPSLG